MKKLIVLFVATLSMPLLYSQDITDALNYSQGEIEGSARFRAMGGAFGALGGDLSAININPAGSAVFSNSYASVSLKTYNSDNEASYFNEVNNRSKSNLNINQGGGVFIIENNRESSKWKKFSLSVAYDNTKNYRNNWFASGTNRNSIANYFLANAQGLRLDEISRFDGETISEAYSEIGSTFGFQHQQAFLGFESFIIEPDDFDDDANASYFSNIADGTFDQEYSFSSTGYNGKMAFNIGAQYNDNLYFGLNLNSHFLYYERSTFLSERNENTGSLINRVGFENNLIANGNGFSFQLGTIYKISKEFRVGISYDSPTWLTIEEETSQSLQTASTDGIMFDDGTPTYFEGTINPDIINVYPAYKLSTHSKLTTSLAYVFGKKGLLSFDYSIKDYSNTKFRPASDAFFADQNNNINTLLKSASTYRLGGEYKVKQFSFRGGYRFEESPYKDEITIGDLSGYSLGLGYNFGNTKLDLAYDSAKRSSNNQLFNAGLTDAANINNRTSNVTLTLGFRL